MVDPPAATGGTGTAAVLKNRPFLLLWLSQLATQVGSNMVLYGLTVVVLDSTNLSSVVSLLFLTFLVPAVLFSAVAGVYVDRLDRRLVLIATNVLRAIVLVAIWAVNGDVTLILILNVVVSSLTVFFAPAEAAMIPHLVPRHQLVSANGLFTLTLNGAFALGYALLGPLDREDRRRPDAGDPRGGGPVRHLRDLLRHASVGSADGGSPRDRSDPVHEAGEAVQGTFAQLSEGVAYIRSNRSISWSLVYLGIAASLVGVIGVLGPKFAQATLGLGTQDLILVVLPLGTGIVMGVLLLNSYGRYVPRRRAIEGGLIALGSLLALLTVGGADQPGAARA